MTDSDNNDGDPLAEGFRDPPERVTEPCLTYLARIMELRKFVSYYFGFVKVSHELGNLILKETKESARELQVREYNYSGQRPLVNQIMLSQSRSTSTSRPSCGTCFWPDRRC